MAVNTLQYLSRDCLIMKLQEPTICYSQRGSVSARAFVTSKHLQCLGIFQPHGNGTYYVVQFQAVETTRSDTCLQPTIGTVKTAAAVSSNDQRPLLQSLIAACRPDFSSRTAHWRPATTLSDCRCTIILPAEARAINRNGAS